MSEKLLSVFVAISVAAIAAAAPASAAGPQAPAVVQSYTGCLNRANTIVQVAVGDAPANPPCRDAGAQVVHFSGGDLTSLTAGTGLTGGGGNGDLSVELALGFRLPQTCSANQGTAWNGNAWTCAWLTNQEDFNSLVALLRTSGTINEGSNPVEWTKLKGVPDGFADGTDDVGPTYSAGFGLNLAGTTFRVEAEEIQRRVAGTCAAGSSIRGIAQDGTVACEGHSAYSAGEGLALNGGQFSVADGGVTPAKLSFDPTTQSEFNSLTQLISQPGNLNDPGNPLDWTKLKGVPAGFADGTDNTGLTSVSTANGLTGSGTGADPLQVAYSYRMPQSCGSGQVPKWNETVWSCANDSDGSGGGAGSHSPAANDLTTLDSGGFVGRETSITIGADGLGLISYIDATNNALKVAHCQNAACTSASTAILDSAAINYTSVTVGADGLGLVSYRNGGHLKVAHCQNVACTTATSSIVDGDVDVGWESSLTVGADGLGLISYLDFAGGSGNLKVAHLSNAFGVPYFHRR